MLMRSTRLVLLVSLIVLSTAVAWGAAPELSAEEEKVRTIGGWETEVSSMHHRVYGGEHVLDGDLKTPQSRWVSAIGDPEPWIVLIRPDAVTVDAVVLYSGFDGAEGDAYIADTYVIEYMHLGEWIEAARVEGNSGHRSGTTFTAVQSNAWRVRFPVPNVHEEGLERRARIFEIRLLQPAQ